MANAGNPQSTVKPNVFEQSAGAYKGALDATGAAGSMDPALAAQSQALLGTAGGYAAAGAAMPNTAAYMNPFTSAVTDTTLSGLDRARKMAQVGTDAAATQAGAFGGSRHGVLGAETNKNFFDTAATTLAGLNKSNFDTALGAGQEERRAQLAAGGLFGNFAQGVAGVGQQQQQLRMQQGSQLGTLGSMLFGTGQTLTGNLAQQGGQQQTLLQALIDAARGQYGGFTGSAQGSLTGPMAALSGANMGQNTSTTKQSPGLLNILGAALGMAA